MRRPHVITAGFAGLLLATGCGAAAQQAARHDPATGQHSRPAPVQDAVIGKPQSGRGLPGPGGQQQGNGSLPASRCSSQRSVAEANGPLPCAPMLLVPLVLHPRHGQPRIIYIRKPCLCASGG
jgi:hypothetical protein